MIKNYIKSTNSVTIIFDGNESPVNIPCSSAMFARIMAALKGNKFDAAEALVKGGKIAFTKVGKFSVNEKGEIVIGDEALPKVISDRLVKFVELGLPTDTLEKFWNNLSKNPSAESRKDLYTFLEKNHIPLTEDGCFTAYKSVREDWLDHHTGTILNKVGMTIKMPRAEVNSDRNQTCSSGLHVAAYAYVPHFGGANSHILEVKVNPRHVVSVPTDYDAQKMRVCEYYIVAEYNAKVEIDEEVRGVKTVKYAPVPERENINMATRATDIVYLNRGSDGRLRVPVEFFQKFTSSIVIARKVGDELHLDSKGGANEVWEGYTSDCRLPKSLSELLDGRAKVFGKKIVID